MLGHANAVTVVTLPLGESWTQPSHFNPCRPLGGGDMTECTIGRTTTRAAIPLDPRSPINQPVQTHVDPAPARFLVPASLYSVPVTAVSTGVIHVLSPAPVVYVTASGQQSSELQLVCRSGEPDVRRPKSHVAVLALGRFPTWLDADHSSRQVTPGLDIERPSSGRPPLHLGMRHAELHGRRSEYSTFPTIPGVTSFVPCVPIANLSLTG